jgi:hypothetical protein
MPRANYAPALAAMIAIPLLWFIPAMLLGGSSYTHEVLQKQLAGRAMSSWVHQSPPWFYVAHAPLTLFPWFLLALVAIVHRWREERFNLNWILAVLVPYSLMSSKLDVYMMALIPPVALIVARYVEETSGHPAVSVGMATPSGMATHSNREPFSPKLHRGEKVPKADERALADGRSSGAGAWAQRANVGTLVFLLILAVGALFFASPRHLTGPEAHLTELASVKGLFVVLAVAAAVGLLASVRGVVASTIAVGLVPLAAFVYAALVLMPMLNELASTEPLVRALIGQRVRGSDIALFTSPHLWTRDMPRDLERVQYVSAATAFQRNPAVIATSRRYASDLGPRLATYRKVAEVRMIGKWFDVYRR